MGVSPIGSLPFNSPTIFHFHELKGVAVWQEKITSTITTVDGVKNPLRLVVSPIYLRGFYLCIYIYIHPTWFSANNSEPSFQHGAESNNEKVRRFIGFSQLRVGIPNATVLRFLLQVLQDRLRFFWQKKWQAICDSDLQKSWVFFSNFSVLPKKHQWTFFSHEWLRLAGSKIGVHLFLGAARVPRP